MVLKHFMLCLTLKGRTLPHELNIIIVFMPELSLTFVTFHAVNFHLDLILSIQHSSISMHPWNPIETVAVFTIFKNFSSVKNSTDTRLQPKPQGLLKRYYMAVTTVENINQTCQPIGGAIIEDFAY